MTFPQTHAWSSFDHSTSTSQEQVSTSSRGESREGPSCRVSSRSALLTAPVLMSQVGQEVEIRPGLITRDANGVCTCRPLRSRIVSLLAEQNHLQFAVPGGLIGVGTLVDPALCRADRLLGMVMSSVGKGPSIYTEIKAEGESHVAYSLPANMT
jgi:hypothetical protein